jgi:hypothetical protein
MNAEYTGCHETKMSCSGIVTRALILWCIKMPEYDGGIKVLVQIVALKIAVVLIEGL